MTELVLASTSAYRRALLERLGLPFRAEKPGVDEEEWKGRGLAPRELAEQLARAKAESLIGAAPGATIIGSDQLVNLSGQIFGKPGTAEGAEAQLAAMAGRSHELITAMAVWQSGDWHVYTDVTTLSMRSLSAHEIARYVAADEPLDCAGSYKIESRGISLFERIETADSTAIMGLPLIALSGILRRLGYAVP